MCTFNFVILAEWPLVLVLLKSLNIVSNPITDHPLYILNASNRSAWLRLSSGDHKSKASSLLW